MKEVNIMRRKSVVFTSLIISLVCSFSTVGCGGKVSSSSVYVDEMITNESDSSTVVETKTDEDEKTNMELGKIEFETKKAEDERIKAEADAKKAEADAKKAEADAKKAEADAKKAEADAKKAEADAKKAEADAKKAEADAKKAEADAQSSLQENENAENINNEFPIDENKRNSLNMLNYLTLLTQDISKSKGSRLYVEQAYSSLINNTNPDSVDDETEAYLTGILDTLEAYRMVDVKRERLDFIYEQNRAQAFRNAMPSPMSILNIIQSGKILKASASALYMALDSYTSYSAFAEKTGIDYLKDGWELDDEEANELHESRKRAFSYMLKMSRNHNLPSEYVLSEELVNNFVEIKNNQNLTRRILFLEKNTDAYKEFGTYWLTLIDSYYDNGDYVKCLDALKKYENVASNIFRKDYDFAKVLPKTIIAAKETYSTGKYVRFADKYIKEIIDNTDMSDWAMKYFVAEICLDLYAQTKEKIYAEKAYNIVGENVNYLVDKQLILNEKYLSTTKDIEIPKNATKRQKEEIKQYNKLQKEERETALPPINEALYLNCKMLFSLADELNKGQEEKAKIDAMLHGNGGNLFLMEEANNAFCFNPKNEISLPDIKIQFTGDKIVIPVVYVSDHSMFSVTVVNGDSRSVLADWKIEKVTRKKDVEYKEYEASFTSESAKNIKYSDGMFVEIRLIPVREEPNMSFTFVYKVNALKKALVFSGIEFERVQ